MMSRNTFPKPQPDSASYALRPEVSNPSGSVVSGWTKNTQKPDFFFLNGKNHPKCENSKMSRDMLKLAIRPSTRGL